MGGTCSTYHRRNAHNILVGEREWKNNSEDLGVDGKIIVQWYYNSTMGEICGLVASGSG